MRVRLEKFKDKGPMEADWTRLVPGLREQMSTTTSVIDSGFNQLNSKMDSFVTKDYLNQLVATLGSNIIRSVPTGQTGRGRTDVQVDDSPNFATYRVPSKFTSVTAIHTEWLTLTHHFHTGGATARKHWSDSEQKCVTAGSNMSLTWFCALKLNTTAFHSQASCHKLTKCLKHYAMVPYQHSSAGPPRMPFKLCHLTLHPQQPPPPPRKCE